MKTYNQLLIVLFLLVSKMAYGDIGPIGPPPVTVYHYVTLCTSITNLEEYPEIALLAFVKTYDGTSYVYQVRSNQCMTKGNKNNTFSLYAVKKSYLVGKVISTLDLPNDKNAIKTNIPLDPPDNDGYYTNDQSQISNLQYLYKIAGFTDTSMVIYKSKEITKYSNGRLDLVKNFAASGDLIMLAKSIPTNYGVELFPNPAQKNAHIMITNTYTGNLHIGVFSIDGKKISSTFVPKEDTSLDYEFSVVNLKKGIYLIYIGIGDKVVWKKLIVN